MDNATYQEIPCISSHWLKDLLESPAECYRKHLDPHRQEQKPSAAMQFGTLVHCLSLTPLQFGDEFVIDTGNRRTKDGKARYAALAATGKIVITPNDFERVQAIVAALKADPDARKLITSGKKERTIIQSRQAGLLPLKARLDVHQEEKRHVVELKTIYDLNLIETAMTRYRYPLSAAFYADLSDSLRVTFVFVQTREPYEVQLLEMTKAMLAEGRNQWRTALDRFDECWKARDWSEAAPVADLDDDPLFMSFTPTTTKNSPGRFDLPIGELTL
ncbi:MAG: PD-(D/E)XK nuclease-like domain-containing protein [Candidatus Competibacteraceae bacterium]|nr:PD-(D/E)XK nuclease-like domain-containing protein [Candidatus Competibacteraceae bacterium]